MNGVDLVIFTGGIGENDQPIREAVCEDMDFFGIRIDKQLNASIKGKDTVISTADARTKVMVISTDEELVIAMDTVRLSK